MDRNLPLALVIRLFGLLLMAHPVAAQETSGTEAITQPDTDKITLKQGPHGGALRQVDSLQVEAFVTQAGIECYVFDLSGKAVAVGSARGTASVRLAGNAKRYRYDLMPNERGGITASVDLSKLAGRQLRIEIQLVGLVTSDSGNLEFQEVASVPLNKNQLDADAIARQKICPVSGKPLGSMGDPIAVDFDGQKVFVCCAGCVATVKADPTKYAAGRAQITVTTSTLADAAAIAAQKVCPVMDEPLGGMGTPIKVMVGNKPIYLCCKGCIKKIQAEPAKYLAMVYPAGKTASVSAGTEQVREGVFKVTTVDAPFIAAQKKCPVMDEPLDAMGGPFKVNAAGKAIYICCPGCAKRIASEPTKYLVILAEQGVDAPSIK
ncbi:hypothetical protein [Rubripirellula reticaptiva]|uniref:Archaeal TRASH domain protein n=1 Tax=Rubripirellula reticaptiva TaxID=2528013 RepID=A0A5C6ECN8_9BACT|nr:hypothetical protein [Rubripirellula reticaptiva]TWU46772.1 Archaeal TRASH domain protein [Rubripirellula reticaptiva]